VTKYQKIIETWLQDGKCPAPIGELLGFRLVSFDDGVIRLEMDAGSQHHNPMGTVHGGVFCDLADLAMGSAFAASLEEGEGFTTSQLSASFLRGVREGRLNCTGRVLYRGRVSGHTESEITDGEGRLVARFTSVCQVLAGR
jgi:uncharacterized protein (TIGR00369 family)